MYVHSLQAWCLRGEIRLSSLDLELGTVVGTGNRTWVFCKNRKISPVPENLGEGGFTVWEDYTTVVGMAS